MNFDQLVEALAIVACARYLGAVELEGMTPEDAMREIVRTILETYVERLAQ